MKTTLKELPSGTIDLVMHAGLAILQFNANCQDALPFCQAQCCRMRPLYSVELTDAEAKRLGCIVDGDKLLLPTSSVNTSDCIFLEETKCALHETGEKPQGCKQWHCSPGGNPGDSEIKIRATGWVLVPTQK